MKSSFKTVALIGKYKSPEVAGPLLDLGRFLESRQVKVLIDKLTASQVKQAKYPVLALEEIGLQADLAVVIGGDGTMLNIARTLAPHDVALVGVNQGRLGFLTDISVENMIATIGAILDGKFVAEERMLLEGQLHSDNTQRLVASASQLLSDLTHFAGVVMTPRRSVGFRHIEFLKLSDTRVLLILVTPEGDVQNRILNAEKSYTPSELTEAANILNQHYAGLTFDEIRRRVREELKQLTEDMTRLMTAALEAGSQAASESAEDMVISGESNLLDSQDLSSNMANLRKLFDLFDRKTGLMQLLDVSSRAQGVQIFIGGESGVEPLDECSVITASYKVDGQVLGTVGVIGPTRMAYERVIPIVDVTAKLLSSMLTQR